MADAALISNANATNTATAAISTPEPCATTASALPSQPTLQIDIAQPQLLPTPSLRPTLSWKSVRSTLSVSERTSAQLGWAVAFLSVVFTIVTLSPAFRSQSLSEKSLKLAEWTALKDFIEECREELAAGVESQACLKATNAKIPPPPYVKTGMLERMRRGLLHSQQQGNGTWRAPHVETAVHPVPQVLQSFIFFGLVLTACVFFFLSFESTRARLANRPQAHPLNEEAGSFEPHETMHKVVENTSSQIIRYPPPSSDAGLRRRREIRTHPIYQHANLGAALHHENIAEVRKRLEDGEDVNEHWPYLIYRLAISPPSTNTAKRLEIARLCLDFGADVNALKAWNGQSALMIAIHFGNVDVAKLLIVNEALVSYSPPDSNITALHRCARLAVTGSANDALEIMTLLFCRGANANQCDRSGETPLHKLLIDSWYSRFDELVVQKLLPVALCLVQHGAHIPRSLKEKYLVGNPLLDALRSAMRDPAFPKRVGPNSMFKSVDRILVSDEEEDALQRGRLEWQNYLRWMDDSRSRKEKEAVKWPSAFQETGMYL